MNTSLRTVAFAIATLGMAGAYAEPQAAGQSAGTESVQISAPSAYKLAPHEFDDYAYTYNLDNGESIQFTQRGGKYYVQLRGEKKTPMLSLAPAEFLTATGARVQFGEDGALVTISNYERLAMSARLPANTVAVASR